MVGDLESKRDKPRAAPTVRAQPGAAHLPVLRALTTSPVCHWGMRLMGRSQSLYRAVPSNRMAAWTEIDAYSLPVAGMWLNVGCCALSRKTQIGRRLSVARGSSTVASRHSAWRKMAPSSGVFRLATGTTQTHISASRTGTTIGLW